jgi:hypothetical protein
MLAQRVQAILPSEVRGREDQKDEEDQKDQTDRGVILSFRSFLSL